MPMEIEIKLVVLSPLKLPNEYLEQEIRQVYAQDGARVRFSSFPDGSSEIMFCWKSKIPGHGNLEIETPISAEDGAMFGTISKGSVAKTRYHIPSEDGMVWSVDYFDSGLVLIEIEGHGFWRVGNPVPTSLKGVVVGLVSEESKVFTSYSLSSVEGMKIALSEMHDLPKVTL